MNLSSSLCLDNCEETFLNKKTNREQTASCIQKCLRFSRYNNYSMGMIAGNDSQRILELLNHINNPKL